MTGKTVTQYSSEEILLNSTQTIFENEINSLPRYTGIQIAVTVTFTVALIQLAMYILRLGIITTLMSDTLVNAFTCAAAFHVVSLQLKDLFGISVVKREGLFKIVMTVYDVCMALPTANIAAVVTSTVFIAVMVLNNEILKPRLAKITRIPLPIELIAIIAGTTLSYALNMHQEYGVNIIGDIPSGLPEPALPVFSLIPTLAFDAFIIAMISYTVTMSLGLTFAQKSHYEIDSNQELLALGLSNCFGSFFSCMPVAASLSRSLFQHTVGGATQLASLVSCTIILVVLLWIGPIFENLPRCVLASIIVVALKNMLLQFTSLKKYWILNKWDALNWLVTFLITVFIGIDIGLFAGILTALLTIFVQGYRPYSCLLGAVPNTDIYLDIKRYRGSKEIPRIKIFHYSGGLNFALKSIYRSSLFQNVGFDPITVITQREKAKNTSNTSKACIEPYEIPQCVILNFSSVTCIDPSGVDMLRELINNYRQLNVETYIAACPGPIFETLVKCEEYQSKKKKNTFKFFPTIQDAVTSAQNNLLRK
ncbi:hypothetical protein ILUMI_17890 [Ignelater luminosus]|uniref:STAS domain-containing protein n=1 Tax=Ignelater luminosus TaxID=2038154 RepID=A0A8K0G7G8_IGNLU|nr:hypothetical protein ILUMI_17890 [Ignelater luminosus]